MIFCWRSILQKNSFKLRDEIEVFNQDGRDREQELYELKQQIVDRDMRLDAANKLVADYKAKVNELQKQIIGLETNNEFH